MPFKHNLIAFSTFSGEHIKNWRRRYFILLDDGSLLGFKNKPETNIALAEPLNNFTVKGCQIMKAVQYFEKQFICSSIICNCFVLYIYIYHVHRIDQNHSLFLYVVFSGQQSLKEHLMWSRKKRGKFYLKNLISNF